MPSNSLPSQLTELGKKNLEDYLKLAVTSTLDQSLDFARDTPGFIASTAPVIPAYGVARAVARQACRQWSRGQGIPSLPGFDAAWGGLCDPYLSGIGEKPVSGSIAPPFTGGQCAGVLYRLSGSIRYSVRNCNSGEVFPQNPEQVSTDIQYIGPIVSISPEYSGSSACGPNQFVFRVIHDGGLRSDTTFFRVNPVNSLLAASFSGGATDATNSPGACGNPPPFYDPPNIPGGLPPLAPVVVDVPGIGPVAVDVSFNPDGSINVELPDLGIDLDIPNPFAVDDGEGGGGGGAGDTTNPGSPGGGGDTGDGGEAEGEAEDGEELVGLLVEVLGTPPGANVFDNNSSTVYRGVGYVRMGYPGRLGVDITGGTVLSPQFFHAQQRGLTAWAVNANVGFNIRTTPYYREIVS